jgi:hypothetical protein
VTVEKRQIERERERAMLQLTLNAESGIDASVLYCIAVLVHYWHGDDIMNA